jgi:hypothetical protein
MFERFLKTPKTIDEEAREIIHLWRNSPEMESKHRERDEIRQGKVRELLAQREQIERERDTLLPQLVSAVVSAKAEERRCREVLEAATRKRSDADLARLGLSLNFQSRHDEVTAAITKLAPTMIDEFIHEMHAEEDKARLKTKMEIRNTDPNWMTGKIKEIFVTNVKAVTTRVEAIRRAIEAAQALKFEVIPESEIFARLEQLNESMSTADFREERTEGLVADVTGLKVGSRYRVESR